MDSTVYKAIESHLMELITQNANMPDYKLPSERMLSASYGASRKPVRRAYEQLIKKGYVTNIHGKGYFISSKLRENSAGAVFSPNNPKIALIIPSIRSQFSHDILAGTSDFCSTHHLELAIHVSDDNAEKENTLLRTMPSSSTKGIILFPVDKDPISENTLLRLSVRRYPLVLVDRMVVNIHASFISSENYQAMVNAVAFLHKKGFEHIVYVTPPPNLNSTVDARINGFTYGLLRSYQMATPKNLLILEGSPMQVKNIVKTHLQSNPETDVLIAGGTIRLPLLQAVQELGLRIPQDLRLMFFDDELSTAERNTLRPYILQQDGYQIGYLAAEALHNQLYGDFRPVIRHLPVSIMDADMEDPIQP
ncbi:MAG: GntR family transcriptional regulator [Oscillospiraceae bacterium]|nr:GntR family transcriptional regulator [Oscillospiraceae bacterium]